MLTAFVWTLSLTSRWDLKLCTTASFTFRGLGSHFGNSGRGAAEGKLGNW